MEVKTIKEQMKEFSLKHLNEKFTTDDIKGELNREHGTPFNSIIPTDYCYNSTNNGINFDLTTRFFEKIEGGLFKSLGPNYSYNGNVMCKKNIFGTWADGKFIKAEVSKDNKREFITYMNDQIESGECQSYAGQCKNKTFWDSMQDLIQKTAGKDVFKINNLNELDNLLKELKNNPDWSNFDFKKGNGIPYAILNKHYRNFIQAFNKNDKQLSKLILEYYTYKNESKEYSERYKWDYIQKNNYLLENINDIDVFKTNLDKLIDAKSNLMTHELLRQTKMFKEILETYPEELQKLFINLFNENTSLAQRVDDFTTGLINLRDKINWVYSITSQTAAFFLFVKSPEKYPVYSKVSTFHSYFQYYNIEEYLQYKNKSNGLRYEKLVEYIHNDLIPTMDQVLGTKNSALDAQDFIWFAGNKISEQKEENIQQKYWMYAAGEDSSKWDEFHKLGIMAIGWDELGDLSDYESKPEIKTKMKELYGGNTSFKNDVHATWQFAKEINIGDIVFVKKGRDRIIGRGIVESDYIYEAGRPEFKNVRKVKWTHQVDFDQLENKNVLKTLTNITPYTEYYEKIESLFTEDATSIEVKDDFDEYTEENFLDDVYIDINEYATLKKLLEKKKNIILQGAPGVGKTYAAKRLAYSIIGKKDTNKVKMIQFHQSYSYEDFIMGLRPNKDGGFEIKDGPFYEFCQEASKDSDNQYFFIIDEINRGNLSKIFGELLMLIEADKRKESLRLLYRNEKFNVPSNVHIIGMMNTADRSLAMIDYALRRRFAFYEFEPAFEKEPFKAYISDLANENFNKLIEVVIALNKTISKDNSLGDGFRIGHSYFCNLKNIESETLDSIVNYEIIPLLKEYWFDEPDKISEWSNKLKLSIK